MKIQQNTEKPTLGDAAGQQLYYLHIVVLLALITPLFFALWTVLHLWSFALDIQKNIPKSQPSS